MPCGGCARRKAALMRGGKALKHWARKTPKQAKDAIMRRLTKRTRDDGV
jgi:hypothetical protein